MAWGKEIPSKVRREYGPRHTQTMIKIDSDFGTVPQLAITATI